MHNEIPYTIRIPEILFNRIKLIPHGRRSEFIRDAIEIALSYEDQSIARLQREIQESEKQIEVKKSLLNEKIKKENDKQEKDKKLKISFDNFTNYAANYTEGMGYKTKDVNEKFGVNLRDYKNFQEIQQRVKNNNFSIEDFKSICKERYI